MHLYLRISASFCCLQTLVWLTPVWLWLSYKKTTLMRIKKRHRQERHGICQRQCFTNEKKAAYWKDQQCVYACVLSNDHWPTNGKNNPILAHKLPPLSVCTWLCGGENGRTRVHLLPHNYLTGYQSEGDVILHNKNKCVIPHASGYFPILKICLWYCSSHRHQRQNLKPNVGVRSSNQNIVYRAVV